MPDADSKSVTQLLIDAGSGDQGAISQVLPYIYEELRSLAACYMRSERPDHTLQATALVHEAYLRLIDQRRVDWRNRAQFFGLAGQMMRRVLVNHARDRAVAKRGGDIQKVTLSFAEGAVGELDWDVVALDDVLNQLAELDARKAQIVEFKFFTGLTTLEIAEVLGISGATVEREWNFARAWLYNKLKSKDADP